MGSWSENLFGNDSALDDNYVIEKFLKDKIQTRAEGETIESARGSLEWVYRYVQQLSSSWHVGEDDENMLKTIVKELDEIKLEDLSQWKDPQRRLDVVKQLSVYIKSKFRCFHSSHPESPIAPGTYLAAIISLSSMKDIEEKGLQDKRVTKNLNSIVESKLAFMDACNTSYMLCFFKFCSEDVVEASTTMCGAYTIKSNVSPDRISFANFE